MDKKLDKNAKGKSSDQDFEEMGERINEENRNTGDGGDFDAVDGMKELQNNPDALDDWYEESQGEYDNMFDELDDPSTEDEEEIEADEDPEEQFDVDLD